MIYNELVAAWKKELNMSIRKRWRKKPTDPFEDWGETLKEAAEEVGKPSKQKKGKPPPKKDRWHNAE